MTDALARALAELPGKLSAHVGVSAAALAVAIIVSAPLVLAMRNHARLRWPVLALAGLVQTIPALALLALFYPLLLGLRGATASTLPVLGFLPALLALTLYALLPLLRGGLTGLTGVAPDLIEAADGIGMTRAQRLAQVELPLAAPVIMAGVRTAAVWTIGAATLATAVGQACLGDFIFAGLQTENWVAVLVGCVGAAGLAIAVDAALGLIERGVGARRRAPLLAGVAALAMIGAAALVPTIGAPATGTPVVVGAKNFSEQYILAALIAARIGPPVEQRTGLGSAVAFRALAANDIDTYVDYAGTLWTGVLGRTDTPPRAAMLATLATELPRRFGVGVVGPLGFENAYVLAMRRDTATRRGITTIADLAAHPDLRLGSDIEFLQRAEWRALHDAYRLRFAAARSFEPTFMYRALASDQVDVISAFSSDGRVAAQDLVVLTDPKGAIPAYDALLLVSPARTKDHALDAALRPLVGSITVAAMRRANLLVDRDADKMSPEAAARTLLPSLPLPPSRERAG